MLPDDEESNLSVAGHPWGSPRVWATPTDGARHILTLQIIVKSASAMENMNKIFTSIIVGAGLLIGFCADRSLAENRIVDIDMKTHLSAIAEGTH